MVLLLRMYAFLARLLQLIKIARNCILAEVHSSDGYDTKVFDY